MTLGNSLTLLDETYDFDGVKLRALVRYPESQKKIQDNLDRLLALRSIKASDEDVGAQDPMVLYVLSQAKEKNFTLTDQDALYHACRLYAEQREVTMVDATLLTVFGTPETQKVLKTMEVTPYTTDDTSSDVLIDWEEKPIEPLDIHRDLSHPMEIAVKKIRDVMERDKILTLRIFGEGGVMTNLAMQLYRQALEVDPEGFQPKTAN